MSSDPTGPLSEFICNLKYSDLPERVRKRVYLITVDVFANAFAGWQANETQSISRLAEALGGRGNSSVIGGMPLSLAGASVLNAYLITAVSACDVYRPALCHVTPEVIPPAFAIAERDGLSGEQLLLAIAVGLETTVRLGLGLHYSVFRSKGWHSPSVIGPFGGAAAIGKLLGLDVNQLRNALGLAGSQASGTFAAFGTAAVKFHQSHGALAGLLAGLAAAENFKTTDKILTHSDGGLFNVMSDGGDPDAVTWNLGEHWELENISLRLWPTAASLQSVISALMAIIQRHELKPQNIRSVQIGLPKAAYAMNGTMGWQNRLSAMLSARYVASVVLHDRACWLDQFDATHLAHPAILDFASSRVHVEIDETIGADGASITIDTLSGERLVERRNYPKGDPRDPLTQDEVFNKLRIFGESRLESVRVGKIVASLEHLNTLENVRTLGTVLGG
ncbi:MAG: MmgE/PrpD family protein [Chloroflexi bacterium]|nr:MmgE/PrpD family protein [Chloroflexota bacterium]